MIFKGVLHMRRKMRKFLSCFLVMIFFISIINPAVFAEDVTPSIVTEVGGVISKNTIWTKEGSPYKLTGNLLISKGAKLTIDEGVRVIGDSSNEFTVLGRIDSLGSEAEKVIFDGFNFIKLSSSKNNINNTTFLNTSLVIAGDKNVVSNSIFRYDYLTSRQYNSITSWGGENCIVSSVVDGGIDIRDTRTLDGYNGYSEFNIISSVVKNKNNTSVSSSGNVKISDSVISDSNVGIQGAIEIVRTKIENNKSGVLLGNWASISDSEFINNDVAIDNGQNITPFKNNSFINNKMNLKMAVTYNPAISTLEAGKNYWGSTDETEIKSKIYDFLDNPGATYVDYSDFFTQPVPVVSVESVDLTNDIVYSPSLESKNLKAEIFPKNSSNQTLKWKSLNPEIADVLANGKVIAKGTGVATIVIESEDGLFSDSCKVVIGGAKQITNNAPINGSISNFSNIGLAGDFLVWNQNASYASTNYYNLKTDETKELTKSNETSWSSTIYKNKLVYNKNVNGMDQLFLYDLTTHNTNQLTNESSWAISPMIFGNKLVYIAYRNGECVILKDLESGVDSQISPTFYNVESPRIYNNHIVYLGQGNGYPSGIYIFNTITNETNMIPDTATINPKNFDIYGNKVYFSNGREIFVYNIDTKEKLKIKDLGEESVSTLRVNKNKIVWSSYSGITLYNTETKLTSKIAEAYNFYPNYTDEIMIDGNKVAWKGEGNGYPQIYVLDLLPSPEAKPMIFNINGLNDISDFVEGEAEPGLTIEFWSDSHLVGNGTSDENGGFHISIPKQKAGTVLVAVATDNEGNTSDSITVVVQDATGPDAPVVNEVSDNSLYVTGTSEPDSIVNVYNDYGVLGTAVTNGNGEFSLTLSRKQSAGTKLIINATDPTGNKGNDKIVTVVDKTPPQVGVGNQTDQSTHVVGGADPGSKITIKVNDVVIATGSNPGQYTFAIPIPRQKAGTKLYVYATDSAGNTSEPEIVIVKDVTAPEKPIVHEVIDRSTTVTGFAEVGSSITVKSGSVVIGLGTVDEKGQFIVSIQKQILGTKLSIYSSDSAGNISEPTETIVQDGTGPDVPQVDIVTDKSMEITGLSEPDALIKVKSNGNIIGTTYTDKNGHFTVSIPKQKVDSILVVTSTDSSGNESEPLNITVLDATNPAIPIVLEVTNNSTSINGYAEVGSTVYCKVGSTIIGSSITNQQGEFSITISKQLAGTKLSISSTDINGNTSESVEIVVSDVISPSAPQVDEVSDLSKTVTGKAEAGSLVKVKVGNVLVGSSIADENGRFSVVIFEQIANTKLRISATDSAGNESESLEVTVLDKTAPIVTEIQDGAIINHDISIIFNEGKATLNGEAIESGAKITSNGNYNLVVTDEAGNKTSISFTIRKPFEVNFLVDGSLYEKVSVYDHHLVVSPTEPAKTGYTFGGWYKDSAYTLAWDFTKDTVQANNITLYAKWTINSYTVNFDSKDGSAVPDINAKYNAKITAPTPPTKVGYTFGGWYKDAAYTTAWDFENDTIPATNITLYVKWATNSHTVTFDSQGGSAVTGITAEYNARITAPESPTKIGYTFGGWYKDAAFTTEWDFENDTVSAINITLYAKWIINRYTVTFDSQGGSDVTGIHANYHSKIT
ncbi:Ig-like domain-containing protein, partial [Neobacillus drentensis]